MNPRTQSPAQLAQAYAKEVFALASESFTFREWDATLKNVATFVRNDEVQMLLREYNMPRQDFVEFLERLLKKAGAQPEEKDFVLSLAIEQRLHLMPQIQQQYSKMWREFSGVQDVHVVSAKALSRQDERFLKDYLKNRFNVHADLTVAVHPGLRSGLILRVGDKVIDQTPDGYAARRNKMDIKIIC